MYGFGAANPLCKNAWFALNNFSSCAVDSAVADYDYWFGPAKPKIAPPPIPSGAHGEQVFPVAGSGGGMTLPTDATQADDVVTEIANQQLEDQKAINAAAMANGGHWYWNVEAAAANAGDAVGDAASAAASAAFNWLPWALGGLGVFALVALSAGGPRRYGR